MRLGRDSSSPGPSLTKTGTSAHAPIFLPVQNGKTSISSMGSVVSLT